MNQITIRKPNDFHHHLRDGDMLENTVNHCFSKFKNVIVMPNLVPPIIKIKDALEYRDRILKHDKNNGNPMMTLYLHKDIDLKELRDIKNIKEISAIKYYPKGATTNSADGIKRIDHIYPILDVMEQEDIPLLIHGESIKPNIDIFKKEKVFIEDELIKIIDKFPKLRIVLEHISTKHAVDFVLKHNIYATITPHHLLLDRNDIFSNGINPHLYCLPILKKNEDRLALLKAAISGNKKFFLGTDNAPHLEENKLSSCGCAGIFNSPVAIEIVTELFEKYDSLDNLEKFISTNGSDFYRLPYNSEYIILEKNDWVVPDKYGDIIPLYCGKTLSWKIK